MGIALKIGVKNSLLNLMVSDFNPGIVHKM